MPQHNLPPRPPLQSLHHLMTLHPRRMIPRQPPLRHIIPEILPDVILITRENPRAAILQIYLHNAQSRCMARGVVNIDSRRDFIVRTVNGHPVDVEGEVVGEIYACISLCGDAVEGVFELEFVDVDGGGFALEEV